MADKRMLELITILKTNGTIRFAQQFCDAVGLSKQHLSAIKSGRLKFSAEHIEKACREYDINANWILGLSEKMYGCRW
ncbi:helix-turn-helix domain-containing protein [Cruoricaptor ignavus]|nr:helix-turn-helix transcriptional regulator [Cruoricaptor ignavus]